MTSILAGLLLLCVLIVIHELGHFLVAKALGVRVLTFSVGFGPKLIKWTKNGTEYCLSAIPLGGYVKMVGESPTEELSEEEKKVSFIHQALWKKSAIAIAGPLFNLVLPIVLFFFIFIGPEKFYLPTVGATVPGDSAQVAGIMPGDKILEIDGVAIKDFDGVIKVVSAKPEQDIAFKIERTENGKSVQKNLVVKSRAEPDPNPVNVGENVGRIGILPAVKRAKITVLNSASSAAIAGLKTFDEIVAVNSNPISSFDDLAPYLLEGKKSLMLKVERVDGEKKLSLDFTLSPKTVRPQTIRIDSNINRFAVDATDFTKDYEKIVELTKSHLRNFISNENAYGLAFADATIAGVLPNSSAEKVGLTSGDRIVSVNGNAVESWFQIQKLLADNPEKVKIIGLIHQDQGRVVALRMQMDSQKASAFSEPQRRVLGTKSADIYKEGATAEREIGVIGALTKGVEKTYDLIKLTWKSLALLVSMTVPVSQIGGPIMIFDVAGQAASQGFEFYIFVMSLVSVNLGLMNLLPIPVLDGGHLMMFFIEAVTRKPITVKTRQIATQLGLAFVLGLMMLAIFNDIARLVS